MNNHEKAKFIAIGFGAFPLVMLAASFVIGDPFALTFGRIQ